MGVVYLAYDEELERKVALKLILEPEASHDAWEMAELRRRFLAEARALAQLSHANVVSVYDVGEYCGQVFMAMEFVEGQSLRAWLDEGRHTFRQHVEVMDQVGRGLVAVHEAGLVHRDVKPENILVQADGRAVLVDFGLVRLRSAQGHGGHSKSTDVALEDAAQVLDDGRTQAGTVMGTPAYMAPEQMQGQDCDARADQFAYCLTYYEVVYGRRALRTYQLDARIREIRRLGAAAAPSRVGVPLWLHGLIVQGLSESPERRHGSMQILLAQLRGGLDQQERVRLAALPRSDNFGIAVYGRTERSELTAVVSTAEWQAGVPTVEIEAGRVTMLAIHTLPPISSRYAERRNTQLEGIGAWVSERRREGRSVVVLGDLNTSTYAPGYRTLRNDHELLDARAAVGGIPAPTFPAGAWRLIFGLPIDHILHDSTLRALEYGVGDDWGSDHRAVWATLSGKALSN